MTIIAAVGFFVAVSSVNGEAAALVCAIIVYLSTLGSYWITRKNHQRYESRVYLLPQILNLIAALFVGLSYVVAFDWSYNLEYDWTILLPVIVAFIIQMVVRAVARSHKN